MYDMYINVYDDNDKLKLLWGMDIWGEIYMYDMLWII